MPEVISKYPEVTIKVIKEAGLRCGKGAPQRILTKCPPERVCLAPCGEICVYGLDEISQMTQVTRSEIVSDFKKPLEVPTPKTETMGLNIFYLLAAVLILIIGFYSDSLWRTKRKEV